MNKSPDLTSTLAIEPMTVETTVTGLQLDPTPAEAIFVRNNLTTPDEPAGEWLVEISSPAGPDSINLDRLLGDLPRQDLPMVLQCSGNGRKRLAEPAPGVQWDLGGMACVDWSGVRLADVVAHHGIPTDLPYFTVLGGDADPTDPARVERSVPAAAALADGLLADRMNGEEIPAVHGGPVRFVMPGFYAVNSVKWVRRLGFTDKQTDADIQTVRYRIVPPGEEPNPDHAPLWSMGPSSRILEATPEGDLLRVSGLAFSDGDAVEGVEVSVDGRTWAPTVLGEDRGRFAWRRFEGSVPAGATSVMSRCRTAGGLQPAASVPNRDGYAVDGWQELAYRVGA